jgi:uncharacterized cysteine cluster protein YcgN (CxxCxxCC family)
MAKWDVTDEATVAVLNDASVTTPPRVCGTCSKCCEGHLHGSAHGHPFWKGRPCHYLESGRCSIYGNHPEDPCKVFKCEWLVNDNIPGWMKPDDVNAILVWRKEDSIDYLDIAEAGEKLRVEVLSWAIMFCLQNNYNLQYRIDGGVNRIGSKSFLGQEQPDETLTEIPE